MLILNIKYDKLYRSVELERTAVPGDTPQVVARFAFGDPVLDWRLMRFVLTYLNREGNEVHRGASCDKFVQEMKGFRFTDKDQLEMVGD